ncbi:MAG TPA: tetratricopeptide repeat protein, partial [Pyrinomonadaceae bacterium]|nr:tetratricopeptide repeat protein [Pyrinomonadaceae bacterium]
KVRSVLTGRALGKGDALVISLELADTRDNRHIWGEQYTRSFSDIFALQQEIAQNVWEKLQLKLTGQETRLPERRYVPNPEAYQLVLEGYYYHHRFTGETLKKSVEIFNRAIEKDPKYAAAYAGLATAYFDLSGDFMPSKEASPRARAAALKALELDSELAEAHVVLASIMDAHDWNWPGSEVEYRRALELSPGYASAHFNYGFALLVMGRWTESLRELRRGQELNPVDPPANAGLGWALYLAGEHVQAIQQLERVIRADPNFSLAHYYLGWVYAQQGRYPEAFAELEKARSLSAPGAEPLIGYVHGISGNRAEAERVLNELPHQSYTNAFIVASLHASLGNRDQAFEWLERAYHERVDNLIWLKVDPRFASLRGDPRYADLVQRIGLSN